MVNRCERHQEYFIIWSRKYAQDLSSIEKREIDLNNEYFLKFTPKHTLERKLLKSAKELRLYLKRVKALEM